MSLECIAQYEFAHEGCSDTLIVISRPASAYPMQLRRWRRRKSSPPPCWRTKSLGWTTLSPAGARRWRPARRTTSSWPDTCDSSRPCCRFAARRRNTSVSTCRQKYWDANLIISRKWKLGGGNMGIDPIVIMIIFFIFFFYPSFMCHKSHL